jgi:hypothetical protein
MGNLFWRNVRVLLTGLTILTVGTVMSSCGGGGSGSRSPRSNSSLVEPEEPNNPPSDSLKWVQLDFYKAECFNRFGEFLCYRTRFADEQFYEPNSCYTYIEGFSFVWGTRYTLMVDFPPPEEPTGNIGCGRIRLVDTLDTEVVPRGAEFQLSVCHWCTAPLIVDVSDTDFRLFGLTIACESNAICEQLPAVDEAANLVLTLELPLQEGALLILTGIEHL